MSQAAAATPANGDAAAPTPSLDPIAGKLLDEISRQGPYEAADLLLEHPDELVVRVLTFENPAIADEILWVMPDDRRASILEAAPPTQREQWSKNHAYPRVSRRS